MKSAPDLVANYGLPYSPAVVRARIANEFRKYQNVTDPLYVDMLYFKGKTELDEALHMWKQRGHVLKFFAPEKTHKPDFMERFMSNDED
jgi:NADH dehydrogenase (ubiquinone) 1 alpha subcomplex subunit 6